MDDDLVKTARDVGINLGDQYKNKYNIQFLRPINLGLFYTPKQNRVI